MGWMQIFVLFSFGAVAVVGLAAFAKAYIDYKEKHMKRVVTKGRTSNVGGIDGAIFKPFKRLSAETISVAEMGDNVSIILLFETFTLFLGFSNHFTAFIETGTWYLNPTQYTMKNPGQSEISLHVVFGFSICVTMAVMASLIKFGTYGGVLRNIHKKLGTYFIPPVAVAFLSSAVWAELMLPGSIPQKIARNSLVVWCIFVLWKLLKSAFDRNIAAHLHYLVAFWGLVCSAGSLRGAALFIGWCFDCKYGYAANPCWGIITGTFFSTFGPMLAYVYMNNTWKQPYAKWALFYSAYYQLLIPLYFRHLADPCYPRVDLHMIYHDYKFLLPAEFYANNGLSAAIAQLGI